MDHLRFESNDVGAVEETWKGILPNIRVNEIDTDAFRFEWESASMTGFTLVKYELCASVKTVVDEPDLLMVAQVLGSNVRAGIGKSDFDTRIPWLSPGRANVSWQNNAITRAVMLEREPTQQLARELTGDDRLELRWLGSAPISAQQYSHWNSVMNYARATFNAYPEREHELIHRETARLVTVATLSAFPTTFLTSTEVFEQDVALPASLRRARAFAEENAHLPVTVEEMARAARMSIRGLQQQFQSSLGVTPMTYLRTVRLHRVREELLASDPTVGASVRSIAVRWGFTHAGRFASQYRREFSENPAQTLRR
jgi:AraC-like DNA-binding protein